MLFSQLIIMFPWRIWNHVDSICYVGGRFFYVGVCFLKNIFHCQIDFYSKFTFGEILSGELNSRAPSLSCDRLDLGFGLGLTLIRSSFWADWSFLLEMNSSRSAWFRVFSVALRFSVFVGETSILSYELELSKLSLSLHNFWNFGEGTLAFKTYPIYCFLNLIFDQMVSELLKASQSSFEISILELGQVLLSCLIVDLFGVSI